jgi:hypothetical protein
MSYSPFSIKVYEVGKFHLFILKATIEILYMNSI